MARLATCTGCATRFDARKALVGDGGLRSTPAMYQRDVALRVRCPNCHRVFSSPDVRLFGFLSPNHLRFVVIGLVVLVLALLVWLPPR